MSRSTMRAALEASIQAAIDFLDALDGDADLEDEGDAEPSLGSSELANITLCRLASTISGDVVRLVDLGGLDQTAWAEGDCTDREDGDDTGIADHGGVEEQSGACGPAPGPAAPRGAASEMPPTARRNRRR